MSALPELCLYWQPIMKSHPPHQPLCFEALARLKDPSGAWISPAPFIDSNPGRDSLVELDLAVLREAARTLRAYPTLTASINLMKSSVTDRGWSAAMNREVLDQGLGRRVILEINERERLTPEMARSFRDIRRKGTRLAIDDFGAGKTRAGDLHELRPDFVKLDRGLVVDAERNPDILADAVDLAATLHAGVVAEGIETSRQARAMERIGIRYLQGFLFGRPEPHFDPDRAPSPMPGQRRDASTEYGA